MEMEKPNIFYVSNDKNFKKFTKIKVKMCISEDLPFSLKETITKSREIEKKQPIPSSNLH